MDSEPNLKVYLLYNNGYKTKKKKNILEFGENWFSFR